MKYTTPKIEASREILRAQEKRVARQRAQVAQAIADRHPADELQARLLIMEQSLIAMARFLWNLENPAGELRSQGSRRQRRIRAAKKEAPPAGDAVAALAGPAQEEPPAPFETIAKAMRKLADR